MRAVRRSKSETQSTLRRHASGSQTSAVDARAGVKSLSELAQEPELRLALDNDAFLRVAEGIIYLRKYRGWTQQRLATAMKTSQAAVARMEGACENITLRTLEKALAALQGRLHLAMAPAELNLPNLPAWWQPSVLETAATELRSWRGQTSTDVPSEPSRARSAKKDTKRWCRGKVGVEHNYVWDVDKRFSFATGNKCYSLACTQCLKQKDWCPGFFLSCRCGKHDR